MLIGQKSDSFKKIIKYAACPTILFAFNRFTMNFVTFTKGNGVIYDIFYKEKISFKNV